MMKRVSRLALGLGVIAVAACTVATAAEQRALLDVQAVVKEQETVLRNRSVVPLPDGEDRPDIGLRTAVLPADARSWSVTVDGAPADGVRLLGHMRGLPVIGWTAVPESREAVVTHDGDWSESSKARTGSRGFDTSMAQVVPGLPAAAGWEWGSYVVISAPEFVDAAEVLLEWKREKGFRTRLATTAETGVTREEIQAWLRNAYETWEHAPEYVLLLGDTGAIPTWFFSENVSDMPYALMDGDDWLPDLMLGRMAVETVQEAETVVAKTIAWQKDPDRTDEGWFTRQLMVGGNFGSLTPTHTVHWVGEQMETLGYEPATEVLYPPFWNGVYPVTQTLEEGVSLCVYRGWAYGTSGWEPPHFTNSDVPAVDNGPMTPVVMSFVCLNGDFSAPDPCFGEVFLRQGTPTEPKGAVAFIGNGEHWSHTRYNDAMAISFFEAVGQGGPADLGGLLNAAKMRFMQYFPHEMSADEFGEESVEFYFHIYNLLGDPELRLWTGAPTDLVLDVPASLPSFADRLDLTVYEADGSTPAGGIRIGVVSDGEFVATGYSLFDGTIALDISAWDGEGDLLITATGADRFAVQSTVAAGTADSWVRVSDLPWTDDGGNGDGAVNPGETLLLRPELTNDGGSAASSVALTLTADMPLTIEDGELSVASIAGGAVHQTSVGDALRVSLPDDVSDGFPLVLDFTAAHDGAEDRSLVEWFVSAPKWELASAVVEGDGVLDPGETAQVTLMLRNAGSAPSTGGSLMAEVGNDELGEVSPGAVTFGPAAPGETVAVAPLTFTVGSGTPDGSALGMMLSITSDEGWRDTAFGAVEVGLADAGAPVGPDQWGYWALDSADLDYPALVPEYRWTDLDTAFGGAATPVPFTVDNEVVLVDLPFPFTFYGTTYDGQIRLSENGWISFDTSDEYEFYNWPLPGPHGNHSMVAPFWDNFDPELPGAGEVFTLYDADAGTFTIQWTGMLHYRPSVTDAQTFQLVLKDPAMHPTATGDGEMLFLYRQITNTDTERQYATVGWENAEEDDGLQLSYANVDAAGMAPLGPGLAVLVTTETPVRVPYALASFTASAVPGGVTLAWETDDPRPVLGWRLLRVTADGADPVHAGVLPASTRVFTDPDAPEGVAVTYQLESVHPYGHRNVAGRLPLDEATGATAPVFALRAAWPNPAPGGANLAFALPRSGRASLRLYDVAGRLVRTLHDGEAPAGDTVRVWNGRRDDGRTAAAGVYFARLEADDRVLTRKVLLVR